jgi:hypothetical protein
MSGFTIVCNNPRKFEKDIKEFMEGVKALLGKSRGFSLSAKSAGEIACRLFVPFLDTSVEKYGAYNGESAEPLVADYFLLKAIVLAMADKKDEGRAFIEKGRSYRTGGLMDEWTQTYYKS